MDTTASDNVLKVTFGAAHARLRRGTVRMAIVVLLAVAALAVVGAPALAEQAASESLRVQHGLIDGGDDHSCAVLAGGRLRCWGSATTDFGDSGQLGYANTTTIGDNETPGSVGPVNLGESPGSVGPLNVGIAHTARAIAGGGAHTCALLDNRRVRCWGLNEDGQLGYANTNNIGDNETPGSAGPVDLGAGRTARAISAGRVHTCALLDDSRVRCWGFNDAGQMGYANFNIIGDDETPGSVGPVDLGAGRTARAITVGGSHTCALLDSHRVRCWGNNFSGQLGKANTNDIGDNETPGSVLPVSLGPGRKARAITAGESHTCALLDNGGVRCWGENQFGQLGKANTNDIGDNERPGSVGTVDLGAGRTARAITAGGYHTCALLDNGRVRCWGNNFSGQLGKANTNNIGDNETPGSVGTVDLGAGRTARAITAGGDHTCALLDNGRVRCWGYGEGGALGYADTNNIGDNETPGSVGPVDLGGLVEPDGVVFPTSPKSLRVSKSGRFTYRFISIPRRRGKISFRSTRRIVLGSKKRFMRLATKSFKARSSARVSVRFRLRSEQRRALDNARTLSFKVTATRAGKTYTTRLRLKRPRRT